MADIPAIRECQEGAISAFLEAAREGDFGRLLQLLDPDIELRSDRAAVDLAAAGVEHGAPLLAEYVHGADAVARAFAGRAELARVVSLGGVPAAAYLTNGIIHIAYLVTIEAGMIVRLDVVADPRCLAAFEENRKDDNPTQAFEERQV